LTVSLASVQPGEEMAILPGFSALVDGREVWVTAVLERTAVVEPSPGEPKMLVNRSHCLVDPSLLRYKVLAGREAARRGRLAARKVQMQQRGAA
jgi:hypothetical protein